MMDQSPAAATSNEIVVGNYLRIRTSLGDDVEGHVLAYEKALNIVVIHILSVREILIIFVCVRCVCDDSCWQLDRSPNACMSCIILSVFSFSLTAAEQETGDVGVRGNLRFLKVNYIKEMTILKQMEDTFDLKPRIIDLASLKAREEAALRQAMTEADRIGVGVTQEAQDIFDALSKTLPVRWDKATILVMTDVRVNEPYLPENVTGGAPAANERVRKVLELERRRLQARSAASQ